MHTIKQPSRTLTLFALIVEGFIAFSILALSIIAIARSDISLAEFLKTSWPPSAEWGDYLLIIFGTVFMIISAVVIMFFSLNIYLYTQLKRGHFTDESARKVYLYFVIYGVVVIFISFGVGHLSGVLYIISGVFGRKPVNPASNSNKQTL